MAYNIQSVIKQLKSLSIDTPRKPSLPDDLLVAAYEEKLDFIFPEDYKVFLMEASDVFVGYLSPLVLSSDDSLESELVNAVVEARSLGVPKSWLPICEDNGDYYCIDELGVIHFWSHDGEVDEKWQDLATWITDVWIEEA